MFDLKGKTILIVGGAGYLGSAVCRGLVAQGATLLIGDLNEASAGTLAADLNRQGGGGSATALTMDVRDESAIRQVIDMIRSRYGRLSALVNATYSPHGASTEEISLKDFGDSLRNIIAAGFVLAREAKSLMQDGGSIVFFSSMYGRVSPDPNVYEPPMRPNPVEYGVAKAGIEQMVRYLAVAWAPDRIRVNAVAPGPFPNPGVQREHPDFAARLAQRVPLGRLGAPEDIVGAVTFLCADEAGYVTGQTLVVDGGWTAW
jgi:NAD(P)-dependent dehydrogenase (short-subunit alcohol dehydrogenase family)